MEENLTYYRDVELPKVKESLKEWTAEFPPDYVYQRRKAFLEEEIDLTRKRFFKECKELAQRTDDFTYWHEQYIETIEKRLNRLGMEVKILVGKSDNLSPEKIARARQFPIGELIQVRRGMALCPFHNERTPSFDVRKNFYHCYGCGVSGDVIDLAMKLRNLTFKQAVDSLS